MAPAAAAIPKFRRERISWFMGDSFAGTWCHQRKILVWLVAKVVKTFGGLVAKVVKTFGGLVGCPETFDEICYPRIKF